MWLITWLISWFFSIGTCSYNGSPFAMAKHLTKQHGMSLLEGDMQQNPGWIMFNNKHGCVYNRRSQHFCTK